MPQTASVRADVPPADIVSFWCGRTHRTVDSYGRIKSGAEWFCALGQGRSLCSLSRLRCGAGMDGSQAAWVARVGLLT